MLGDGFEVINLGIGGRKMQKDKSLSYWNEAAFSRSQQMDPDILIIMLGTNDASALDLKAFWLGTNNATAWDQEAFT